MSEYSTEVTSASLTTKPSLKPQSPPEEKKAKGVPTYLLAESATLYSAGGLIQNEEGHISQVGVDKWGVTTPRHSVIYTANLGPCRGVVAELKNGNFALYHAGYNDLTSKKELNEFVAAIQGNVNRIIVFQKRENQTNFLKAPLLAAELAIALKQDVQRVEVSGYSAIVCDSNTKEVLVIPGGGFKTKPSTPKIPVSIVADKLSSLEKAISSAIPIQQTYQEIIDYKGTAGQGLYAATAARIQSHLSTQSSTEKVSDLTDDKKGSTGFWVNFKKYLNPSKSSLPVATNPTPTASSPSKEKKARDIIKVEPGTTPTLHVPTFESRSLKPIGTGSAASLTTPESPAVLSSKLGLYKPTPIAAPISTKTVEPSTPSSPSPSGQFPT